MGAMPLAMPPGSGGPELWASHVGDLTEPEYRVSIIADIGMVHIPDMAAASCTSNVLQSDGSLTVESKKVGTWMTLIHAVPSFLAWGWKTVMFQLSGLHW